MTVETVDAVVVGAGHNGLVAATLLADAGWEVLVCEATAEPGGAVRSAELTAPGFLSDVFSAFYPLGAASPVLRELGLAEHGLRWRHAPEVLAHLTPEGTCTVLSRDLGRTAAGLGPDGAAWRELAAQWHDLRDPLLETILRPFPPVRGGTRLVRALGPAEGLRFARLLIQSVHAFAAERFRGEGPALLLAGNALHTDLGPDAAGSAVFGWLLCMLGQDIGFPVPEGGAGRLVAALGSRLAAAGGRVDLERPVRQVLVRDGRAVGIRDAEGGVVLARRAVLADVAAPVLYRDLVGEEQLPAGFLRDLAAFRWDTATVKLDWALDGPVPWTAEGARGAGTVHLGVDLPGLRRYAADLASGRPPEEPFVLFGQMTTADPSRSPAGTESAWAYTHVPRRLGWTEQEVLRHADLVERAVERQAPGFRDLVRARVVAGPADLERRNPNLVDGTINGGTAALDQQLVFRPTPGLGRADTPVDRLFLAGASAHPGGAVHGAPGANAARAALAAAGRLGPLYRGAVRAAHRRLGIGHVPQFPVHAE